MTQTAGIEELIEVALAALDEAYAPYSNFRVGAVLRASDGRLFRGCNVENASYPAGMCAERGAVAHAVSHGVRDFDVLVVATEADAPTPPCGFCRQVLMEFTPRLEIVSVTRGGHRARWSLRDLLPEPFTPASLTHA